MPTKLAAYAFKIVYAAFYEKQQILSMAMLDEYTRDAAEKGLIWTK